MALAACQRRVQLSALATLVLKAPRQSVLLHLILHPQNMALTRLLQALRPLKNPKIETLEKMWRRLVAKKPWQRSHNCGDLRDCRGDGQ